MIEGENKMRKTKQPAAVKRDTVKREIAPDTSWPAPEPKVTTIPMDTERLMCMAHAYASTFFEHKCKAFQKNPNTENWQQMIRAMLIFQQMHSMRGKEEVLANTLYPAGIGEWGDIIVKTASGRRISELCAELGELGDVKEA
jgi:hypothetical protein